MTSPTRFAWHFLKNDRTAYGGFVVEVGKTYEHAGDLIPCKSGLHASARAIDALSFASGAFVTLVRCEGEFVEHGSPVDKFVCRRRTALWGYDATDELWTFSRLCALEVLPLWPDAPQVVKDFLETGDEDLRAAARDAAWDAARDAARAAAWDAARDAARAAARDAAWDAARDAARAAAWDAARDAARAAFYEKANGLLESTLFDGAIARGLLG